MNIYIIIFIILVFIFIVNKLTCNYYEHYWNIAPYELYWNIFKCYSSDCVKDKSYKCYEWCNDLEEESAAEACRINCENYGDEQFHHLKVQNYLWDYLLPRFKKYSLLNE